MPNVLTVVVYGGTLVQNGSQTHVVAAHRLKCSGGLCGKVFATSPQFPVEMSMEDGRKEIEYEVVKDCRDNCITVCNTEVSGLVII